MLSPQSLLRDVSPPPSIDTVCLLPSSTSKPYKPFFVATMSHISPQQWNPTLSRCSVRTAHPREHVHRTCPQRQVVTRTTMHATADGQHLQDAHYATEHPQVPYQHPGYNLHYGYAVHPAYTQQTWEPVYLQAQPPSAYSFPLSPSASSASNIDHAPSVPIYAPVPVSPYSTLVSPTSPLSHAASDGVPAAQAAAESTVPLQKATSRQNTPEEVPPVVPARSAAANSNESKSTPVTAEQSPLEYYGNAPQVMFQTPSELLSELNASGSVGESSRKVAASGPSTSPTTAAPEPDSTKRSKGKTGSQAPAVPTTKPQTETQRKAYFRRVAEAVGFPPTDP